MPVDYAEPTKLQDFQVEVFQPGNNTPTLTNPANSPTYETAPGQLTVPNRDTGLGKPNNLPERQNSLRNDGQYRTIDVTPSTTAKPALSKQSNQIPTKSAADDAVNQAVYYSGFFVTGVIDAINDDFVGERYEKLVGTGIAENLAYQIGKKSTREAIDLINDGIKNGEKLLDDLWRNKPTFEIPQIKIPKFDIPELPDLEPPKFPDFKFPEVSLPKPQPINIPKPQLKKPSLTEQVKNIDIINCGTATIKIAYVFLYTGFSNFYPNGSGGYYEIKSGQQSDIETFISASIKDIPELAGNTASQILEGAGQSGFNTHVKENDIEFIRYRFVGFNASSTGYVGFYNGYKNYNFPYYRAVANTISVPSGISIKKVLNSLSQGDIQPEVYDFYTEFPDKPGCFLPLPEPPPPPPPPPEDDCCRMGCCPKPTEIDYRLIKKIVDQTLKEQRFPIEVPICKCEYNTKTNKWLPKTDTVIMEVFATSQLQAFQLAQLHLENARQAADLCLARNTEEPIAAIPQSWQIRHEGGKPQLVIHCAEKKEDGKYGSAMYPITVPHWKGKIHDKPPLPAYKKGNWEGILVLADNTKVTVNAANEAECTKILNAIKPWIKSEMLKNSYFKGGKINADIKPTLVKPMYGRYFKTGQKDNKPDWRVDFL